MSEALELAHRALAHVTADADEAEASVHSERSGLARFAGSAQHQPTLVDDTVVTVRAVRDGRVGLAVTNRTGEDGLREVADPGRAFLAEHEGAAPGSVVAATLEGTRPLLVEVQALVAPAGYGTPARRASGVDPTRLALLLAVLGRRAGIGLGTHDVYANLAGGLSITEPGLDLAVALALASSLRDRPVDPRTVAVGEVGLLGELRPVSGLDRRLREAARLGFERAVVPAAGRAPTGVDGIRVVPVATLRDAVRVALLPADPRSDEAGKRVEELAPVMIEPETRVLG